jgi:hypothetical protein
MAEAEPEIRTRPDPTLADLLASGNILAVEDASRTALAIDPLDPEAWRALGLSLLDQGRAREAEASLRRAMAAAPTRPDGHVAYAAGQLRKGSSVRAVAALRRALALRLDDPAAHTSLAHALMPGDDHYAFLNRVHAWVRPRVYLEIGIRDGRSLALARPPTYAIGVDPHPSVRRPFVAETRVHALTSDDYFNLADTRSFHAARPVDLAFIDGLHSFEQSLRDFINVERVSHRNTLVLLHDCIPLDPVTSGRVARTQFYTGDVWKTVVVLREMRPDLAIHLVAVPPTGMAVVGNLDPMSTILDDRYHDLVTRFVDLDYWRGTARLRQQVTWIPNDSSAIKALITGSKGGD